jgi:hypothetical protein
MGSSILIVALVAAAGIANSIPRAEVEQQDKVFERWWNDDFVWKFDALPKKGGVPKLRIPYSGYIYLDKWGGTADVLGKYDTAFNRNQGFPATSWERADSSEAQRSGFLFFGSPRTDWYGHCNGWTAAAIRHAEPQNRVKLNGVEFSPADIKGLLAEVYMYNEHEVLAGENTSLNPGTLHAVLANWLGRGSHPIAMDSDPGKEIWNYPIYAFATSSAKHSKNEIEVKTNILYARDTEDQEYNDSPRIRDKKSFHYMLHLNGRGDIVGGYYFNDSDTIDFVWVPLNPEEPGDEGNEAGNPHISVAQVMQLWRKSVARETRRQWLVVDLADKDRAVEVADPSRILPRNIKIVPPTRTARANDQ